MLSKNEIKDIQSLSHKKFRDSLNWFVAEGPKIVNEFISIIPQHIEKIYATEKWLRTNKTGSIPAVEISDKELERISHLQTPNEVLAVVRKLPSTKPLASSFSLYLDTIQDPGNFGTIIRIADWFGITAVICSPGCADVYNPKVVQSTMASIARVNVYYDETKDWLKNINTTVFAATLNGTPITEVEKANQGILIIGNESKGIQEEILSFASKEITIPKKGNAESLNAAVATGIILSHLLS